jgi:AcrR family transcriptional regulator
MSRPSDPHAKIDLLRAAEAVFVERGLDLAKVEEITLRAGKSKGAFYLHFDSKEEAFRQIVETFIARLSTCIEEEPLMPAVGERVEPAAILAHWREKDASLFEFLWQNRGLARLLMAGGRCAAFAYLTDEFAERNRPRTVELLHWGKKHALFRADLDAELAASVLAGAYDRVARELITSERKPDIAALCANLQRTLLGGLGGPALRNMIDRGVRKTGKA